MLTKLDFSISINMNLNNSPDSPDAIGTPWLLSEVYLSQKEVIGALVVRLLKKKNNK